MNVILEKYGYAPDMEAIDRILTQIQNNLDNYESQENLAACMGLIDLTSLNSSDTEAKITALTQKVNNANKAVRQVAEIRHTTLAYVLSSLYPKSVPIKRNT